MSRVLGEHVPDERIFEDVYRRQIRSPRAFWAAYPLPSIAMDDPAFVRPIPRNSWGGASQALTALRTPRWMEFYGKYSDFSYLMTRWVEAISRASGFLQQMDPQSGEFTPAAPGYSPAALVYFEFVWRLYGVRGNDDEVEWNCRLPEGSATCVSSGKLPGGGAELRNTATRSQLLIGGKGIAEVEGEVRMVTDLRGRPLRLIGTAQTPAVVVVRRLGKQKRYSIRPDEVISL